MAARANGFGECSPLAAIDVQPIVFGPAIVPSNLV